MKNKRHYFANKGPSSQSCDFPSSHVWMWELDCKESWVPKNWYFWTVVLEKTIESPLDCKKVPPVHLKNQSWILTEGLMLSWNSNTLATRCEELTHLKGPWCWEKLKMGGEGDDKGWGGWMLSLTQWTWVCVSSGELVMDREDLCATVHRVAKSWTRLSNWTELNLTPDYMVSLYLI